MGAKWVPDIDLQNLYQLLKYKAMALQSTIEA